MSTKYKFRDQRMLYYVTLTVINWIDVFSKKIYKDILLESIKYCQVNKGLEVYAWVVMTNHVHLIIGTNKDNMSDIIRDMKKYTSVKIIESIQENSKESRKEWIMQLL